MSHPMDLKLFNYSMDMLKTELAYYLVSSYCIFLCFGELPLVVRSNQTRVPRALQFPRSLCGIIQLKSYPSVIMSISVP